MFSAFLWSSGVLWVCLHLFWSHLPGISPAWTTHGPPGFSAPLPACPGLHHWVLFLFCLALRLLLLLDFCSYVYMPACWIIYSTCTWVLCLLWITWQTIALANMDHCCCNVAHSHACLGFLSDKHRLGFWVGLVSAIAFLAILGSALPPLLCPFSGFSGFSGFWVRSPLHCLLSSPVLSRFHWSTWVLPGYIILLLHLPFHRSHYWVLWVPCSTAACLGACYHLSTCLYSTCHMHFLHAFHSFHSFVAFPTFHSAFYIPSVIILISSLFTDCRVIDTFILFYDKCSFISIRTLFHSVNV